MSSLLSAELAATCNALGSYDKRTGKYFVDSFTLDTVKDLIRYLRRDDEDHEIRRHLGQTKVLETDLLPILINHSDNLELFDVTLRLAVNLTNPPLLLYREEIPTEKSGRRIYLQLLSHLHSYKANSFTNPEIWTVFAKRLSQILEIDSGERDEDSGLIVERILILVRNILHVPTDDVDEKRPDNDASVHDQVLWALNQSGLLDIILYMSSENEKPYFMHILEIISLALREQNPTSLADAALQRSMDEKIKDEQELLSIRSDEVKKRNEKIRNFSANRHSRFGGTFVVQNMKSISDNSMICHKPLNNVTSLDFNVHKGRVKKHRNSKPADDISTGERRSAFAIRLFLKEFCIEFLNASYNTMMYYVKDVLVRAKAQKNDETYYLWAMKFFMEFNRNYNFQVKLVSETMSVSTFHYVQQQMEKYGEMMIMDKKKTSEWMRRLHLALKAYHELLLTMMAMDKSTDKSVQESSKVIKSNIFYVLEYREFILHMMLSYDDTKMPRAFLKDLVETVHIFLKMLEHFCKRHGLVVQKKVRSKGKKKAKAKPASKPVKSNKKQISEETKQEMWDVIDTPLYEMLQEGAEFASDIPPFDATLERDIDEQKGDCTKKIQKLLSSNKLRDAVALLRAAREVWPENDMFGNTSVTVDEEVSILKMIFMANIGAEQIEIPEQDEEEPPEESQNEEDDEEEEEEDRTDSNIVEADFSFDDFINRFANPKVTRACSILLQNYERNSTETNHCIVKMLHRVAWDCKLPGMLFQATLFSTFQNILSNNQDRFKELQKFAVFVVRKFTEVALKNPKAFVELLFWKNSKEAYDLESGYEEDAWKKKSKVTWTEEQEEELRKLYNENQSNPSNENDVIDWILDNLIEKERSRQGVIKKLKEMGLIFRAPTKKSTAALKTKVNIPFTEEEDEKLKELWDLYCGQTDPMSMILVKMPMKRPRHRFVERLLTLGVIQDKKECRKKSQKKSGKPQEEHDSASEVSDSGSEDSDGPTATKKTQSAASKKPQQQQVSNATIIRTLIASVDAGLSEPLKWIAESLEEVALDQEAEGYDPEGEGIPLVPIMQDCVEAMENEVFQNTLKCLGINPPSDEQESYWRIPANIHFESIRKRCETITKAIDKTLIAPEVDEELATTSMISTDVGSGTSTKNRSRKDSTSDDDEDLFDKLRNIGETSTPAPKTKKKKAGDKRKRASSSSDNENSNNQSKFVSLLKSKSKKKQHLTSDSEDSVASVSGSQNNTMNSEENNTSIVSKTSKASKKSVHSSDSDSDSNTHNTTVNSEVSNRSTKKAKSYKKQRINSSSSDSGSEKSDAHSTQKSKKSANSTLQNSSFYSENSNQSKKSKKKNSDDDSQDSSTDHSDHSKSQNSSFSSNNSKKSSRKNSSSHDSSSDSDSNNATVIFKGSNENSKDSTMDRSVTERKQKQTSMDSDSDDNIKSSGTNNSKTKHTANNEKLQKKKRYRIDSNSSEDDDGVKENIINKSNTITSKDDSEKLTEGSEKYLLSEDSNSSTSAQTQKKKKRKTLIMSDDDEEEEIVQKNTEELFDSLL